MFCRPSRRRRLSVRRMGFSAQERREGPPAASRTRGSAASASAMWLCEALWDGFPGGISASRYAARRLAGPPPRVRQALGGPRLLGPNRIPKTGVHKNAIVRNIYGHLSGFKAEIGYLSVQVSTFFAPEGDFLDTCLTNEITSVCRTLGPGERGRRRAP